jgi:DNA-binding MarR family transcriptional regulator
MLSAVASREDASVTELARRKRITKGAVSQILKRLEHKGLVEKRADSRNASRLQVRLTTKGRRACRGHDRMHDDIVEAVRHHVGDLDEQTLSILHSVLDRLGVLLDRFEVGKE